MIKIGNAQAFWGDTPRAPLELLRKEPGLNVLTLDYLAEVSLSIMAYQKRKNPALGYAEDFIDTLRSILPMWEKRKFQVITNGGGLNPRALAKACQAIAPSLKIGVVEGDDVLEWAKGNYVTANAYLGAFPIAELLKQGADIVITGRVADPSLAVAPCIARFGWKENDLDKLAQATVAGHLIECGTQVTGGISTHWETLADPVHLGFPVIEMKESGDFVITKPLQTGGQVAVRTVKEQLLYELGDPACYLSPDVTVSFLGLQVKQVGLDRVEVTGAKGLLPPETLKVSATSFEGYKAFGMLTLYGRNLPIKGAMAAEALFERLKEEGYTYTKKRHETLGRMLRLAVFDPDKEKVERFTKEVASLVTSGPQGVTGYTTGRPKVLPVYGYTPLFIPRSLVHPKGEMLA